MPTQIGGLSAHDKTLHPGDYASYEKSLDFSSPAMDAPPTVLQQIEYAADQVERLTARVAGFNDRFDGSDVGKGAMVQPVPQGYAGQMERLGNSIMRLQDEVARLERFG